MMKKIILLFLLFLFPFCLINAQNVVDKNAGVGFRVDDDQPHDRLRDFMNVFQKHGLKFTYGPNVQRAVKVRTDSFWQVLNNLALNGHEIGDHSPNHYSQFFEVTSPADTNEYSAKPGVDHISMLDISDSKGPRICLRYTLLNTSGSGDEGQVDLAGNMLISRNAGEFSDARIYGQKFYTSFYLPSLNIVVNYTGLGNLNSGDPDTAFIQSFWAETKTFGNASGIAFKKLTNSDVEIDKDGFQLMAQHTLKVLKKYGISQVPTVWIQPGGAIPYLTKAYVKDALARFSHYHSAATYPGVNKCFNETDHAHDNAFGMQWGDFTEETQTLQQIKNVIADRHARHFVSFNLNHFVSFGGAVSWEGLLANVDSILQWCISNNLPVKTWSGWADVLYRSIAKPTENIMPPLGNDLNGDNYPDGYNSGGAFNAADGVSESNNRSFSRASNGPLFSINRLGGIEKGVNTFSCYTKGSGNQGISVIIDFPEAGKQVFFEVPASASAYTKYSYEFYVPEGVSFINMYCNVNGNPSQQLHISGMEIRGMARPKIIAEPVVKRNAAAPFASISLDEWAYDADNSDAQLRWSILSNGNHVQGVLDSVNRTLHFELPAGLFWSGKDSLRLAVANPAGKGDTALVMIISDPLMVCRGEPLAIAVAPSPDYKSLSWSAQSPDPGMKPQADGSLLVMPLSANTYKLLITHQDNSTEEHQVTVSIRASREVQLPDTLLKPSEAASKNIDLKLAHGYTPYIYNAPRSAFFVDMSGLRLHADSSISNNDTVTVYISSSTCDVIKRNFIFTTSASVREEPSYKRIEVFPNPVSGLLNIKRPDTYGSVHLRLYNLVGELMMERVLPEHMESISTGALGAGIYFLQLTADGGEKANFKIIKQ